MAFIKPRELGGKILRNKECLPSPPSYVRLSRTDNDNEDHQRDDDSNEGGTPKGHVPVMVGMEEKEVKRFVVPTRFMKDPSIVALLQLSADVFGYDHQGVLRIPCHPEYFQKIID
ncbi:auxin-responsive protein SAUR71-like [Chenopodium quinoa]|uniref:auxin-responsive protein SAUR71-like n=1 Tax=Chenopodium quinoa TaxID=63459 RepID=UPI000B76E0B0|nr:auxin-responsive protein SAUR71-like [Chenopodium quinoa]